MLLLAGHVACAFQAMTPGFLRLHSRRAHVPAAGAAPHQGYKLEASWAEALRPALESAEFADLCGFLEDERAAARVLPTAEHTFAAFQACPFDAVKVVILGQDPYPTPGNAHGLSFSVPPDVRPLPGSLRNIYS